MQEKLEKIFIGLSPYYFSQDILSAYFQHKQIR